MGTDTRYLRTGRALPGIALGLVTAAVFELVTVLATQDKAIRAVSPWQDDPYDVAVSLTQFAVPVLAVMIGLRLLAWSEPGREARAGQLLRATAVLAGMVGLTAGAEWAAVAAGAHRAAWTSGSTLLIAGLVVVSVLTMAAAVVVVSALRSAPVRRQRRCDWLGDVVLLCARVPVVRLWVPGRRAASARRHAMLMFSAASLLAGAAEITPMAIRERWTDPLLISWAVMVAAAGNLVFCMVSNAAAGFITRPPRSRAQLVAETAAMSGAVALLIAVAFRAGIWRLGSSHPLNSVGPMVALTLGAGVAAALVAAGIAFARSSATAHPGTPRR